MPIESSLAFRIFVYDSGVDIFFLDRTRVLCNPLRVIANPLNDPADDVVMHGHAWGDIHLF